MHKRNRYPSGSNGLSRPKRLDNLKRGWYIVDISDLLDCKALKTRFYNRKAAILYKNRRFGKEDINHIIIKGRELRKFQVRYKKVRRLFYSKWPQPERNIASWQAKKSFRTKMRRWLYGYRVSATYGVHCQRCYKTDWNNPKYAKLYPHLIAGRRKRLCPNCKKKVDEATKGREAA